MASRLAWLGSLKSTQLKALAVAIGANSSGTKAHLTTELRTRLANGIFPSVSSRHNAAKAKTIVSIDMGIKNLAYCRLNPSTSPGKKPRLVEWKRIDVFNPTTPSDLEDDRHGNAGKDVYHPAIYASAAYNIITTLLQPNYETHILIERQRFRSMGGASVLEWTLKVNMFEAMLYAVLETLKKQGIWEGEVHDIRPGHVSLFWLGKGGDTLKGGKRSEKKLQKKKDTIALVGKWLEDSYSLGVEGVAKETATGYLERLKGERKSPRFQKLDDLADCVAQGMAVLKWEENQRMIWEEGENVLAKIEKG